MCKAVVSIAEELGVDHIMSALDISMLAEVTGGRRAGLLDALERMQGSCSGPSLLHKIRCDFPPPRLYALVTEGWTPVGFAKWRLQGVLVPLPGTLD